MCLTFTLWNFLGLFFQKNDHQRQSFRKGFFPKPFQVFFGKKLFLTVDLCREKNYSLSKASEFMIQKLTPHNLGNPCLTKNGIMGCCIAYPLAISAEMILMESRLHYFRGWFLWNFFQRTDFWQIQEITDQMRIRLRPLHCHVIELRYEYDLISGDSWMYPYQRTPMENPYISPI